MLALVREAGAERSYGAARRLFFCLPSSIGGKAILSICSGWTHLNIVLLIVKLKGGVYIDCADEPDRKAEDGGDCLRCGVPIRICGGRDDPPVASFRVGRLRARRSRRRLALRRG